MTRSTPPLEAPYYGAPFPAALERFFRKYATFRGRAGRAEYWWMGLAGLFVGAAVQVPYAIVTGDWREDAAIPSTITTIIGLATLVPSLALGWRRLHDTGRSGAWTFIVLVPVVGWIVYLIFVLTPAQPGGHRYDTFG